jgi:hypothetical protein
MRKRKAPEATSIPGWPLDGGHDPTREWQHDKEPTFGDPTVRCQTPRIVKWGLALSVVGYAAERAAGER